MIARRTILPWGSLTARFGILAMAYLLLVNAYADGPASSFEQRFGRAYDLEKGQGDVEGALSVYESLLGDEEAQASGNTPRVLHSISLCFEKLGRLSEARHAWRRIADEYPHEKKWADLARKELRRIAALADRRT